MCQLVCLQELDTLLADLVEKGVAAEADVVQQLRQVLPEEVMDLVPSELKRWALYTFCWAQGYICHTVGAHSWGPNDCFIDDPLMVQ